MYLAFIIIAVALTCWFNCLCICTVLPRGITPAYHAKYVIIAYD